MKIHPLHDNVLLKVLPPVELKTGKIIMPQDVRGRDGKVINPSIPRGEVVEIGPGIQDTDGKTDGKMVVPDYKVGDIVLYSKGGFDIASPTKEDPARTLRLVIAPAIIAKIEEDGEN